MKSKIKNRNGNALVFMLMIFLVISILTTSILFIFNSNLKQAKHQQNLMEAYYLAYSGAEMAYYALLAVPDNDLVGNSKNNLTRLKDGSKSGSEFKEEQISFGNGKIDILANVTTDEKFDGWIKVTSTGTLDKSNVSYTRILYINPDNPVDKVWKDN